MMENKPPTALYMQRIYLSWINHLGQVRSQKEFAEYLGMDRMRFNRYYNGSRTEIDYQTALFITKKAAAFGAENPYELLDILDYPKPVEGFDFSSLPPDDAASLRAALAELTARIKEKENISDEEYRSIRDEVMERFGWKRINDKDTTIPDGPKK